MRKLLLFLLLTVSGYSQTASLIAHGVGTPDGTPTTTVVLSGASTANSIIVIADNVGGVTDSDGHAFVQQINQNGYDTWTTVWVALGITVSSSDTITVQGNYPGVAPLVLAFSHLASFDKYQSFGNTNTSDNPISAGPITPANPNEVVIGVTEGTFNTIPSRTYSGSTPSGWSQVDAVNVTGIAFADYLLTEGSGTPATATFSVLDNSFNGHMAAILAFTTEANPLPLTVTPTSLPTTMRTKAYPQTCIVPAGGAGPYVVTLADGTLPAGLTFDGHCITGNATTTGTTNGLVFHVVDHAGASTNTNALSITVTPLVTTLSLNHPAYGFVLFPGAKRQLGVIETDPGATGKVDYSIPEGAGFATLSCTTNCPGNVQVTITGTGGNIAVAGTVGSYSINGCTNFHITATSRDTNEDGSHSSDTAPVHICKGDHLVETQPTYNQAFFGQQKFVMGYVLGQVDQSGTWTCTAPDNSSCNAALADRTNRDVVFTAPSTVGRYKLTYTSNSVYDGTTASNYSWIYVGGALTAAHDGTTALPITKDHTEAQACFADPAFGSRNYTVKADGTGDFPHMWGLPIADSVHPRSGGFIGRVFNQDTTGTNPTQYPDWFILRTGGTRDLPVYICGVTDSAGHLPIMQAQGFTNGPGDALNGTTFQGGVIEVAPFQGSPQTGYDTSYGPDYVNIVGLAMRDADAVTNHNNDKIGVWGIGGRHLNIEGMSILNMRDGALLNNNTIYFGVRYTEYQSVIGSYFDQCGSNPGYGDHCYYTEGMYPLVVGNHFGTLINNAAGSWIKNRGGGSIMAANHFSGSAGYTNMWWGDMSDSAPYTNVEMALGAPGDANCGDSPYCNSGGVDFDIRHIMSNEEALAHDYFYGNIATGSNGAPFFSYAAQNTDGCVADYLITCTEGADHTGGFMLWNNTFNNMGVVGQSNDVFYNNGYNRPGVFGWPRLTYQNNSFWTDGSQGTFQLDNSPQFQANFATNLFATGTMSIASPIQPGNAGWGSSTGGQGSGSASDIWSAYAPKDSYLSGVSSANFLYSPTVPYSTSNFKPGAGSPLVGAGSAISEPLMAVLPVRFEPDPINGFMVARTESVTTIGARSSGIAAPLSVTTTSFAGGTVNSPYTACASATGGTSPYTWTLTGTPPTGLTLNSSTGCLSGTPTTAGTYGSLIFHATDAAAATANSQTLSITIAPAVVTPTPPTVTTTVIPSGLVGTSFTFTLTATGGSTPYTWARTGGTLPAGLTLNTSTGVISGTPTTAGTTTGLVFTATGNDAQSGASSSLTLVIASPAPPPSTGGTSINGNATITGGVVIQ